MTKVRAIYKTDIAIEHPVVPVFELRGDKFICIDDEDIRYDAEAVLQDDGFLIFTVELDERKVLHIR